VRVALGQVVQVVELRSACLVFEHRFVPLTISEVGQLQAMLIRSTPLCQGYKPCLWEVMQIDGGSAIRHVFMIQSPYLFVEEVDEHEFALLEVEGDDGVVVDHGEAVEGVIGAVLEELAAVISDVHDGFGFAGVEDFEDDVCVVEGGLHLEHF
jgi:hypothetical protein